MSELYGYVRVSTKDQCEERQLIAMQEFGVPEKNIFWTSSAEKTSSGLNTNGCCGNCGPVKY
mgnify:CR=1 FL=1